MILYRVAEGGPFDLLVDGVTIENITDELVNAKVLIPDTHLQDIVDAYNWRSEIFGVTTPKNVIKGVAPELATLLDALTEENNDGS